MLPNPLFLGQGVGTTARTEGEAEHATQPKRGRGADCEASSVLHKASGGNKDDNIARGGNNTGSVQPEPSDIQSGTRRLSDFRSAVGRRNGSMAEAELGGGAMTSRPPRMVATSMGCAWWDKTHATESRTPPGSMTRTGTEMGTGAPWVRDRICGAPWSETVIETGTKTGTVRDKHRDRYKNRNCNNSRSWS